MNQKYLHNISHGIIKCWEMGLAILEKFNYTFHNQGGKVSNTPSFIL